jgi:hypothetical protein
MRKTLKEYKIKTIKTLICRIKTKLINKIQNYAYKKHNLKDFFVKKKKDKFLLNK